MMRGTTLFMHYENGRPLWRLSDGTFVAEDAAKVVLAHPDIVACDTGLFRGMAGQSWRYVSEP
jgi:hypothetical protein